MTKKETYEFITKIVSRADTLGVLQTDKFTALMDLDNANERFQLRLEELLSASDLDFIHDFVGIQNNIDRNTGDFKHFVPRFAE